MLYSKNTNGFYLPEIHGDAIPSDAVEITNERHTELLDGQSAGKIITADENGYPILVDPPPAQPFVPQRVTMRQARLALLAAGHLDAVEAAIAQLPREAQIEWEFASDVERQSPLVEAMREVLNLDDAQIDDLFVEAGNL